MEDYELTLVLDPDLSSANQKKLVEKIKKIIEEGKGKVNKEEEWGKKELAYPINKKKNGIYFCLTLNVLPEVVPKIDKKIKAEEEVMRYLIIRKEE
jgi:small subunit ribosomal protein S6